MSHRTGMQRLLSAAAFGRVFLPFLSIKAAGYDCRSVQDGALRALSLLPLFLVLTTFSTKAQADCNYSSGSAATINFQPPASITVSPDTKPGPLWTSPPITPGGQQLKLNCSGTTSSGIVNTASGLPTGTDDTLFPTNIPWLSYRILHPDTSSPLSASPNEPIKSGQPLTFSVASALQLVVTGPVTSSGTLSGQLGIWQTTYNTWVCTVQGPFGGCWMGEWRPGTYPLAFFNTSAVRFVMPACKASVDPTFVYLPTVPITSFGSKNSTAGQTPFNVVLNCSAGTTLSMTLTTDMPASGVTGTGVIASSSGSGMAQGIGVQILDKNASATISFGTPILVVDATPNGTLSVPFYARYYKTAGSALPGLVKATAYYTLTYQ